MEELLTKYGTTIGLVNLHRYKHNDNEVLIKCDRTTPVGNKFVVNIKRSHKQACIDYYNWYLKNINCDMSEEFYDYENYIHDTLKSHNVVLGCWCVTKCCHTKIIQLHMIVNVTIDILREYIDKYNDDGKIL